ncbi:hypothetical protein Vretimale_15526 [Volvox reticuliferus]|uniref:Fcf2 pre-rRNA processing C-terminal domain-containing protein n=1 Tax=Volvox reticuliferus TaxID=1737510 RepID=A0A8J4CRF7_9CHLO|nr:hypothetical protein Vretifemale_15143 [Volvox reticuliferus]GIM12099.1 hypothetical protein Vretimale_15526 [Volvox reticuliferus]
MVTTRRGFHRQNGTEVSQVEGPSTSFAREQATAGRGRKRLAAGGAGKARQLHAVDEGSDYKHTMQIGIAGEGRAELADEVRGDDSETLSTGGSSTSSSGLDGVDHHNEGEGDDDGDSNDVFSTNFMGQLASSLKAAFQVRAGVHEASPAAGSSHLKLGISSDPDSIRWEPERQQQNMLRQNACQRVAPGIGATKEKDLAHKLLAPPRVKPAEDSSSLRSKEWFQLPATKITDEMKQELRLLRLRGAYDPKRFYKSLDDTKFPKHFQIGTVLDNPQDFYSSRLTARQRGVSITQELLSDPVLTTMRKKRYAKLQEEATRYQKVKKRKTDLVRKNPNAKRPKHK